MGRGSTQRRWRGSRSTGHFGLPGMRERAAIVKGQLDVRSARGGGTEIELRVPGRVAYRASAPRRLVVAVFGRETTGAAA